MDLKHPLSSLNNYTSWLLKIGKAPLSGDIVDKFMEGALRSLIEYKNYKVKFKTDALILNCLLEHCQEKEMKKKLVQFARVDFDMVKRLVSHKSGYKIHIVSRQAYTELVSWGVAVELIDASVDSMGGMINYSALYLKILEKILGSTAVCVIYISGLKILDDLFLKWCAELTVRDLLYILSLMCLVSLTKK